MAFRNSPARLRVGWLRISVTRGKSVVASLRVGILLTGGLFASRALGKAPDPPLSALVSSDYAPKLFGPAKWLGNGASYTTLEESSQPGNAKEVVRYETAGGRREVLVSIENLTPPGAD